MAFEDSERSLIRGLIYPIQFETNPVKGIDRVMSQVINAGALGATPEEYLNAVRSGLESKEQLSDLIPQNHSEQVIRGYLKQVRDRLESALRTADEAAFLS
jgi:hypothetical protein